MPIHQFIATLRLLHLQKNSISVRKKKIAGFCSAILQQNWITFQSRDIRWLDWIAYFIILNILKLDCLIIFS
jgi:hypothetical protein